MANETLQGEKKFHFTNYILVMPRPHAKMPKCTFEKCTTKTELCNGKIYIKKLYTRL